MHIGENNSNFGEVDIVLPFWCVMRTLEAQEAVFTLQCEKLKKKNNSTIVIIIVIAKYDGHGHRFADLHHHTDKNSSAPSKDFETATAVRLEDDILCGSCVYHEFES